MTSPQTLKRPRRGAMLLDFLEELLSVGSVGDMLYIIGFRVEYTLVRFARGARAVLRGLGAAARNLLLTVARPILLGLITLLEDLAAPFVRIASGIRHLHELPQQLEEEDAETIRAARLQYVRSGVKKYYIVVWNALTYFLPIAAAFVLFMVVRNGLGLQFVLDVQVNGESVGYVASEQVFENAREDVQSRINTAKQMLLDSGAEVTDTSWEISPSYTLTIGSSTMTESEIANAILRTAGDEIVNATAVYIDDALSYVTTEGDHLRTYLESIKQPYEDVLDASVHTDFAHEIRLVDGVYLKESVMDYDDILSALNEGSGIQTYTAASGDTVQSVVDATGVSFDSLAMLNTDLLTLDQEIEEGRELITGVGSAELLKVKVICYETETVAIPFETQNSESSDYDFGKVVTVQEGVEGSQDVTYEVTMIDGVVTDRQAISYNVTAEPVTEVTITGTKLKNGMVAQTGTGSFIWPVPNYKYVSRWMSSGHRGADICAPAGSTIIAADSGTVIAAGWHWSYGNYVEIDHGNGYTTLYAHMLRYDVTVGQSVSQGEKIGEVGSTGNSTGNHCHFEMTYNGSLFSARSLFPNM